jgi:hypothetical protein
LSHAALDVSPHLRGHVEQRRRVGATAYGTIREYSVPHTGRTSRNAAEKCGCLLYR